MLTAILVILILAFLAIATILAGGIGLWTRFVAAEEILNPSTPWEQFKFGVFFGLGLMVSVGVAKIIVLLFSHSGFNL